MLAWALASSSPSIIRYPKAPCPPEDPSFSLPLEPGRGVFVRERGGELLLAFTGGLYSQALEAAALLEEYGVSADLYNLRFIKPLDEEYLVSLLSRYGAAVFAEDGVRSGGIGEYAGVLAQRRHLPLAVLAQGVPDTFGGLGKRDQLLSRYGLDGPGLAAAGLSVCRKPEFRILPRAALG
jgi:1-deoxy-D-xylulose-5-phosphate synthase